VAEAIVLTDNPYELRPHIKGYPVQRFDLARDVDRYDWYVGCRGDWVEYLWSVAARGGMA
jgi:hypothetical protein